MANLLRQSLAWRAGLRWYALAIFIPVITHLFTATLALWTGADPAFQPQALLAYLPLTLLLAAGEEIGWQGFALPRLRMMASPLSSALIFGKLHATFHLPTYSLPLPAALRQASPFALFLLMVTAREINGPSIPVT